MTELPETEQLLTATEAVEAWGSRHGRAHFAERQLQHWRRHGVIVPNGERIKLRARKLGRVFLFTLREIDEFARTVAEVDGRASKVVSREAERSRQSATGRGKAGRVAAAERLLDEELGTA